ncbi:MAG: porin family protein [Firmicutes bacterium]|nr:porin family protein [Bacillota bacterium]MCM1401624.1 porin family protein [Bacteroides sp.]MCM1477796.1 porin family protein [Bacteroides sp.]
MALSVSAQAANKNSDDVESYKYDFGASLGMSGYLGDANESNLFKHPGFAGALNVRYLFDSRWALRAQLGYASISGNTAEFDNVLPFGEQYSFKSNVIDLAVRGECNFFSFGIGETYKRLRRWTPFVSVGLGASMSSSDGNSHIAFSLPMGLGVRYKLSRRVNLALEFTMTKVFGDKVDSDELTDLYKIKSSFLKNTDWYSSLSFGISYEFGARCSTCNRLD